MARGLTSAAPQNRWVAGGASAGLSLLAHFFLIDALLSGSSGHRLHSRIQPGLGTTVVASDTEPTMTLIFLDAPGIGATHEDAHEEETASTGQTVTNPYVTVANPTPQVDAKTKQADDQKDNTDAAEATASDQLGQATLFGRYMGQIQARVERAWLRPRTPIGNQTFDCRVQIAQNKLGEVLEVTLRDCNGDSLWQVSLVHAIERASPLPAPPDPAVFTDSLRLSFRSGAYVPGGTEEGFEPPRRTFAAATSRDAPVRSLETADFENSNQ